MQKAASTSIEPHEPFAFFRTDSLKFCPQVCDLHERFGTDSAKIHEFLDLDGEVVQVVQEFPAQKNVNKTNKQTVIISIRYKSSKFT